jgi:hypothetical protein
MIVQGALRAGQPNTTVLDFRAAIDGGLGSHRDCDILANVV